MAKEKILDIIADQMGMDPNEIELDNHLKDDLGMDDIDIVEMILQIEEEYDISISDIQIDKFHIVRDVVDYVMATI